MGANERQVGGNHYKSSIQHWDFAAANEMDYFAGTITKYITRWKLKGGIEDLEKAKHYLEKYIELERAKLNNPQPTVTVDDESDIEEMYRDPDREAYNQREANYKEHMRALVNAKQATQSK